VSSKSAALARVKCLIKLTKGKISASNIAETTDNNNFDLEGFLESYDLIEKKVVFVGIVGLRLNFQPKTKNLV
jgi:2',3'-cyclic-nucleotide 2'-phosphodiesterase (5'-nucleotidase family)